MDTKRKKKVRRKKLFGVVKEALGRGNRTAAPRKKYTIESKLKIIQHWNAYKAEQLELYSLEAKMCDFVIMFYPSLKLPTFYGWLNQDCDKLKSVPGNTTEKPSRRTKGLAWPNSDLLLAKKIREDVENHRPVSRNTAQVRFRLKTSDFCTPSSFHFNWIAHLGWLNSIMPFR
jgi:hypothetical protein